MQFRSGKSARLYTLKSTQGAWTNLTEFDDTGNVPAIEIEGVLYVSGSYTSDLTVSGSLGGAPASGSYYHYPALVPATTSVAGYYVQPTSGSFIQIKDAGGDIIHTMHSDGTIYLSAKNGTVVNTWWSNPITVQLPLSYFDSKGDCKIVVFGKYR